MADDSDGGKFSKQELTIVVDRKVFDDGTSVLPGLVHLKRRIELVYNVDAARLSESIFIGNVEYASAGAAVSPLKQISLADLLEGVIYEGSESGSVSHDQLTSPVSTNKYLGPRGLYYIQSTSQDAKRCSYDENCGQSCTWSGLCEPEEYGYAGLLLPSATFFLQWKSSFELGHWPMIAWKYTLYCSAGSEDENCLRNTGLEAPLPIIIFRSQTFSHMVFENTGSGKSEKFSDMEFQVWKFSSYVKRQQGCKADVNIRLYAGKDCDVPDTSYTFVKPGLYVSSPQPSGDDPLFSEIYSERVTGLRFYSMDVWQMSLRLRQHTSTNADVFLPIFWIQRQSMMPKIDEKLQFSILKDYGGRMLSFCALGWGIYTMSYFMVLTGFFYFSGCIDYCSAAEKEWAVFKPDYL
jgi:hypothetical protein